LSIKLLLLVVSSGFCLYAGAVPNAAVAVPVQQTNESSAGVASQPPMGDEMSYEGLPVVEVKLSGVPVQADRERLLRMIPQQPNAPFDRDKVRQSIKDLFATGRFADIRAETDKTSQGGIMLSFVTAPNYFVGGVTVEGSSGRPSANQIVNASKLQLGQTFTDDKLNRALENIGQLMEENGYYKSSVKAEEHKHEDTQQVDIVFRLSLGPHARVGAINVEGNPGYSEGQIEDIADLHPTDFVSVQRVTNALERLRRKYQKQDRWLVQVAVVKRAYRPQVNAVDYTLDIQPGPTTEIRAEGFKISRGTLKKNVPVFEENALDDDLLNEGRRNLLNYLQSRGYFDATVEIRKHGIHSGHMNVIYQINAGETHKVVKVSITGNKYFPQDTLRSLMQVQPAGHLLSHGRYSQRLLNSDVSRLESLYQSNGFENVKISSKTEDNYQGVENAVAVELQIEEGPQTLVNELHIVGADSFPKEQLPPFYTVSGQPFSESSIASDRESLLNFYFNHGFPDVTFEASAKPAKNVPNRVDVTFTIHEGQQVFVDRVLVSGLEYTRPAVVQRQLEMKPGDPLSQIAMLRSQQSLYDLGIFSQVDTAVQNPTGEGSEKNVLVQISEAKRYTFTYGGGFEFQTGQPSVGTNKAQGSTGVSPLVSFGVTRLNFRGRNHTITFKTDLGSLEQRVLLSSDIPRWFNSNNWKLTLTGLYDNSKEVSTFTSERLEGSLQAEQQVNRASTMIYSFTYRRVKSNEVEADPAQVPLLSFPVLVGMPGLSYIRNTRDNDLESTKGTYMGIDAGVASSYFGSETDFSRFHIQQSSYYAFGKNRSADRQYVFARSTQIGIEDPFGNTINLQPGQVLPTGSPLQAIPLPERFLMGGGNSHRGFGLNQAGPRDPVTGFPLGGSALFLNNLELRFPPVTLPFFQDNLSFAIFHDAGNVFTDSNDMLNSLVQWKQKHPELCESAVTADQCSYNYISQAVGLGVRYKTPIGPVRFDFGYNLNPPRFPSCQASTSSSGAAAGFCPSGSPVFAPQQARHFNVFFSIGQTF
jgi:outer membrane protein insertion porin family